MTTIYYSLLVVLLGFCPTGFALLPPILLNKIVISNLETIVNSNAISMSIFVNLRREINIETAFLHLVPMNMSCTTCYIYLSIVLTVLYGQLRFYAGSQTKITKFRKLERFTRVESVIKNIVFLIIVIFMKDIESAS